MPLKKKELEDLVFELYMAAFLHFRGQGFPKDMQPAFFKVVRARLNIPRGLTLGGIQTQYPELEPDNHTIPTC